MVSSKQTLYVHPFADPLGVKATPQHASSTLGPWQAFLTDSAVKAITKLGDRHAISICMRKIGDLTSGHFSSSNAKRINHWSRESDDVALYEAKLSRNLRLIWQVDIVEEGTSYRQIVLILSVESHDSMDEGRKKMETMGRGGLGVEYARMCQAREAVPRTGHGVTDVFKPATFPIGNSPLKLQGHGRGLTDQEHIELHERFGLVKLIQFTRRLIATIATEDTRAIHAFKMSSQEAEVVQHPGAALVIGRSGSGKTSVLLARMVALHTFFRQNEHLDLPFVERRQLFLTQSPILADRVKSVFEGLLRAEEYGELSPERLQDIKRELQAHDLEVEAQLGVPEGEVEGQRRRLGQVKEQEWPLFLSFDNLLGLLEVELGLADGPEESMLLEKRSSRRSTATSNRYAPSSLFDHSLVDLATFAAWFSTFPPTITKHLDVASVWAELLGVIKGSKSVAEGSLGHLSKEDYVGLSERKAPAFKDQRSAVWEVFKRYEAQKRSCGMSDKADRTFRIIRAMQGPKFSHNSLVSYLSVDEAQDLLILDFELLRLLCPYPAVLTCVGDTAQTIAEGCTFRFQDLSASLYEREEVQSRAERRAPCHVKQFQLTRNYRSHGGITRCANTLIQLIVQHFPDSIDRLAKEESIVDGPPPLWLGAEGRDFKDFTSEHEAIEFGSAACVLVRDETSRRRARDEVGETGLILTVLESKGLEFDSVLLYRLFESSATSPAIWRTLTGQTPFDSRKHTALLAELRLLYVAVTRARKSVWIFDSSSNGECVKTFLLAQGAVRLLAAGESLPSLGDISSSADWKERGIDLFQRRIYSQAAVAFNNATDLWNHRRSLAHASLETAVGSARAKGLSHTSTLFDFSCAADLLADTAETAPNSSLSIQYWALAAQALERADRLIDAGHAFEKAEHFQQSAISFKNGGDVDNALRLVYANPNKLDEATKSAVTLVASLEYSRTNQLAKGVKLFPCSADYIDFLRGLGFTDQSRSMYERLGDFETAGRLAEEEGLFSHAAELYLRAQLAAKARPAIVEALWAITSLDSPSRPDCCQEAVRLLKLWPSSGEKRGVDRSRRDADQFEFFKTIYSASPRSSDLFAIAPVQSSLAARVIAISQGIKASSYDFDKLENVTSYLEHITSFVEDIRTLFGDAALIDLANEDVHRLLGIASIRDDDEMVRVSGSSPIPLLDEGEESREGVDFRLKPIDVVKRASLGLIYKRVFSILVFIDDRLKKQSSLFPTCLAFRYTARCSDPRCLRPHTSESNEVQRIGVLLSLANLMRSLAWISRPSFFPDEKRSMCKAMQREWQERLTREAFVPRPFVGGDAEDLASAFDKAEHWLRARQTLATYSLERLWELRRGTSDKHWYLSSLLISLVVSSSLAQDALSGAWRQFDCTRTRNLLLQELHNERGSSLPFILLLGLDGTTYQVVSRDRLAAMHEFFETAVARRLKVDVGAFMALIEDVIFISMLAVRGQGQVRSPWHGLVLPRSFAKVMLKKHRSCTYVDASILDLKRLLHTLYSLAESLLEQSFEACYLHHENVTIHPRNFVRVLFLAHIIQLVSLVGVNIDALRSEVVSCISALTSDIRWPNQYRLTARYAQARSWPQIERALVEFKEGQHFGGELIALALPGLQPVGLPQVPRVRAQDLEELYRILDPSKSKLSAAAPAFVPKPSNPRGNVETENQELVSTPRQQEAARIIQKAFARYRRRVYETSRRTALDISLSAKLKAMTVVVGAFSASQRDGRTRRLFLLGPAVELHFALEEMRKICSEQKAALHKLLRFAKTGELEVVMKHLNSLSVITSKLEQFRKLATPQAHPLLQNGPWDTVLAGFQIQLSALPALVLDIRELVERREIASFADIEKHYLVAAKAFGMAESKEQ